MKFKKIQNLKKYLIITGTILTVVPIVTVSAVACSSQKPPSTEKKFNFAKPINVSQEPINYVAFGDSITAGFNAEYGYGLGGFYHPQQSKQIYGLGYPSFLARYIQGFDAQGLASFNNFAISGSTTGNWLYLLGVKELNNKPLTNESTVSQRFDNQIITTTKHSAQDILNSFVSAAQKSVIPEVKTRLTNYFGTSKTNIDTAKFITDIKKANLITFTLGANDLFASGLFWKVFSVLAANKNEWNNLNHSLNLVFKEITKYIQLILNRLRELNPNAKIDAISYPMPLIRIANLINGFVQVPGSKEKVANYLLNGLNDSIKNAVINFNQTTKFLPANYINIFNETNWLNNAAVYDQDLYSIHPTVIGYRQMAKTIFLKMTLSDLSLQQKNRLYPLWSIPYLNTDENSYAQQLNFGSNQTNNKVIQYVNQIDIIKDPIKLQTDWSVAKDPENEANIIYDSFLNETNLKMIMKTLYTLIFAKFDASGLINAWFNATDPATNEPNWLILVHSLIGKNQPSQLFSTLVTNLQKALASVNSVSLKDLETAFSKLIQTTPLLSQLFLNLLNSNAISDQSNILSKILLANFMKIPLSALNTELINQNIFIVKNLINALKGLFNAGLKLSYGTYDSNLSISQAIEKLFKELAMNDISIFTNIFNPIATNVFNYYEQYYTNNTQDLAKINTSSIDFQRSFQLVNSLNLLMKSFFGTTLINKYFIYGMLYTSLSNQAGVYVRTGQTAKLANYYLFINKIYGLNPDVNKAVDIQQNQTNSFLNIINNSNLNGSDNNLSSNDQILINALKNGFI